MYDTKKYNPQYISFTLAAEFTKQFYIETFFLKLYLCSIHIDKSLNYHNQKARIQWLIESIGPDFHCGVSSYLR